MSNTLTQEIKATARRDTEQITYCPCCEQVARFERMGVQCWPMGVAQSSGLPQIIQLWRCDHCNSTLSELDLHF